MEAIEIRKDFIGQTYAVNHTEEDLYLTFVGEDETILHEVEVKANGNKLLPWNLYKGGTPTIITQKIEKK